jgi:MoxR-like ATPase
MAGIPANVAETKELLARGGYLASEALATSVFLALTLKRPLLLEGEAGVGKTELAKTLATALGAPLIRLQCFEGLDASQALYDWDCPRQLLHLRAAEAAGARELDPGTAAVTLGAVLKYREDPRRVLAGGLDALLNGG